MKSTQTPTGQTTGYERYQKMLDTIKRAKRYLKEGNSSARSAVLSACATMCFDATDAEVAEMTASVRE